MRILHTSDWHLGQSFYGKSRAHEHEQFLAWLITQVKHYDIDAVIVAGDIFDTATPPSYAREIYYNFIAQMHQIGCHLVVLAGNHDSVAMLSESKSLLSSLSAQVVPKVDTEDYSNEQLIVIKDKNDKASAIVCAIPFIRPRDIMKSQAGQSASDKQQQLQQAIAEHYQSLYLEAEKLKQNIADKEGYKVPIIATGHLTALGVSVADSKSDAVRDIYIGTLEAFPSSAFPPADYIALGHIHRAQTVAKSEHIRYSGSPIPLSFDEAKQNKSVFIVSFTQDKLADVEKITIPSFQPMAVLQTKLEDLTDNTKALLEQFSEQINAQNTLWLDVEIESAEHLNDLQQRLAEQLADAPVEVLLLRRCKKARKLLQQSQGIDNKVTLAELSHDDVFQAKLESLDLQSPEELARKARLQQLFQQTLVKVEAQCQQQTSKLEDELSPAFADNSQVNGAQAKSELEASS
ncbi:exonuclease subunit SbcD [Litorilituus sediminis]|uniref:Nuclease SbcCD subunit D n=1 Tax=Litorilituus sediminis TaxID=718192 RepID=A0A4P6P117_9GAMM|nr:exonuclease subunit SbcD [Litorilituus sediminis]QBG34721.1 exonuclease subunit SbcD [Litorilituus sediminis]